MMRCHCAIALLLVPVLALGARAAEPVAPDAAAVDFFEKEIRPLLVERCQKCHGEVKSGGGLKLTGREALLKGGESGPAVVPGKPNESLLVKAVGRAGELKMPPKEELSAKEVEKLRKWVARGAAWPDEVAAGAVREKHRRWWAVQPIKEPKVPKGANPIDAFITAKLEAHGLSLSPQADRRTLLRRVTFDLTGLPPTAEEIDAFQKDDSPDAYEKAVEKLIASPAYGQRWARHWLDVVRYADYHDGNPKARNPVCEPLEAYRYRDWVVRAFNRDMPFDQFITHQIAGDLLPAPDGKEPYADGLIATTFLINGAWDRGDADKEKMVSDMVDDQIDTIGKAFLGLTLGCARCHDHKFDPLSQTDYYALAGIFYSTRMLAELGTKGGEITLQRRSLLSREDADRRAGQLKQIAEIEAKLNGQDPKAPRVTPEDAAWKSLVAQRDKLKRELIPDRLALAVSEGGVPGGLFPRIQDVPLHIRGSYTRLGPVVPRAMPKFFAGDNQPKITSGSGRKELAAWVVSKQNPLTARVIVNRVWAWHFGQGLVRTPNNFGLLSEPPSHPELLDWLAAKFVEDGWSLKKLHRRIVLSATYRQSSSADWKKWYWFSIPQSAIRSSQWKDPENRWLGRFAPRRLEAEAIRDSMLFVAGRLDLTPDGPATHDLMTTRRSLYVQTARWDRSNFATLFDAANPDAAVEARNVSTVAPQALFLLNHEFVLTQARHLADRVIRSEKDDEARVKGLFRLVFARSPTTDEMKLAREFIARAGNGNAATAWRDLAHVLLCSNEFVYFD